MLRWPVEEEELRGIRVLALVGHGHDTAAVVRQGSFELIRESFPPGRGPAAAGAGGVAALDHEVLDVPVEADALVVAAFGELDEVPHGFGRVFGIEFKIEITVRSRDARVAFLLDPSWFEHVLLVAHDGAFG